MKKTNVLLASLLSLVVIGGGAVVVSASVDQSNRPAWISAEGKIDINKMPDNAQLPYQCWNGKTVTLDGKTFKEKEQRSAIPGSTEHKRGMDKMSELRQAGAVSQTADGEVLTIDESNPAIQKIMQKYESQETPQCR